MARLFQLSFLDPHAPQVSGGSELIHRQLAYLERHHDVRTVVVDWAKNLGTEFRENIRSFPRSLRVSLFEPFPCSTRITKDSMQAVIAEAKDCDFLLVQGLQCYGLLNRLLMGEHIRPDAKAAIVFHDIESEYYRENAKFSCNPIKKCYYHTTASQFKFLERQVCKTVKNLIFLTERDKESMENDCLGIMSNRMVLEPMGRKLIWNKPNNKTLTVGYFGDCSLLVNSLPLIKEVAELSDIGAEFRIAGRDTNKMENLPPNARGLGFVDDLQTYISSCDLLWFPIRHPGGLKIKLIDAIESGAPVITTKIGADCLPLDYASRLVIYETTEQLRGILASWRSAGHRGTGQRAIGDRQEIAALDVTTWL